MSLRLHTLNNDKDCSRGEDYEVKHLFSVDENRNDVPICKAVIPGKSLAFIIDWGAAAKIITVKACDSIRNKVELKKNREKTGCIWSSRTAQVER